MRERKDHLDGLAISLLVVCCLFWAGQQILIKATVTEVPPLWQAGLRFAGAALLLLLWCRVRGIALWARDGTGTAGLIAGLLFAAEFACIYLGLKDTSASRVTVFLYTSPFWMALLLPRFVPGEHLRAWLPLGRQQRFCMAGDEASINAARGEIRMRQNAVQHIQIMRNTDYV